MPATSRTPGPRVAAQPHRPSDETTLRLSPATPRGQAGHRLPAPTAGGIQGKSRTWRRPAVTLGSPSQAGSSTGTRDPGTRRVRTGPTEAAARRSPRPRASPGLSAPSGSPRHAPTADGSLTSRPPPPHARPRPCVPPMSPGGGETPEGTGGGGGRGARDHPDPGTSLTARPPRERSAAPPSPRGKPRPQQAPPPPARPLSPAPARRPFLFPLPAPVLSHRCRKARPCRTARFTTSRGGGGSAIMFGAAEEDDADFLSPASG